MDTFQPVSIVEDFLKREFYQQKKFIIELPKNIDKKCGGNNNCICANLCYVVKNLNAEHFTNYLESTPHAYYFGEVVNYLVDIARNMREKIPHGKELLFVKNFTEDEKNTVCHNIDSFFWRVAGLGILGLPPNSEDGVKIKESEHLEERAKKIKHALLNVFDKYKLNTDEE